MSEKKQLILMAKYNQLMNQRIVNASDNLSSDSLAANKGAFFKSVIGTLNHIMIGDILWLKRFATHPSGYVSLQPLNDMAKPSGFGVILFKELAFFREERSRLDHAIIDWCNELQENDLDKPLNYTNYQGEVYNKRLGDLVLHVFLHQIHHRGQVTTLLSQAGIDFGETDLPEMIPDED